MPYLRQSASNQHKSALSTRTSEHLTLGLINKPVCLKELCLTGLLALTKCVNPIHSTNQTLYSPFAAGKTYFNSWTEQGLKEPTVGLIIAQSFRKFKDSKHIIVEASKLRPRAVGSYRILQQRRIVKLKNYRKLKKHKKSTSITKFGIDPFDHFRLFLEMNTRKRFAQKHDVRVSCAWFDHGTRAELARFDY